MATSHVQFSLCIGENETGTQEIGAPPGFNNRVMATFTEYCADFIVRQDLMYSTHSDQLSTALDVRAARSLPTDTLEPQVYPLHVIRLPHPLCLLLAPAPIWQLHLQACRNQRQKGRERRLLVLPHQRQKGRGRRLLVLPHFPHPQTNR
jgi:hypothetical protein